jgi:hypothetical protein
MYGNHAIKIEKDTDTEKQRQMQFVTQKDIDKKEDKEKHEVEHEVELTSQGDRGNQVKFKRRTRTTALCRTGRERAIGLLESSFLT